jgi:hypothetical protein
MLSTRLEKFNRIAAITGGKIDRLAEIDGICGIGKFRFGDYLVFHLSVTCSTFAVYLNFAS